MNQKIIKPTGLLKSKIVIRADHNNVITVEAWEYDLATGQKTTPMDTRQMVLALQKVVMDYCAGIFEMFGRPGGQANGTAQQDNQNNNNESS